MTIELGVVMDPISSINPKKDSTLAMLIEAQRRGWHLAYMEPRDLFVLDGQPRARIRELALNMSLDHWFNVGAERVIALEELDVLLMRRDPPFEMEYIYATYILELAQHQGTLVVNDPAALRSWNEKVSTAWFPQCTPPTLISRDQTRLREFISEHQEIIVKPLDVMGGQSIFRLKQGDPNTGVVLELMTERDTRTVMAQKFIPEIAQGDKRILLVDGQPIPYALARIPAEGDFRGNLARGARGEGRELTTRDRWICTQIGPTLRERGLLFVGLDVIGDYLTEINVTSPTGVRELDRLYGINICATFFDAIEAHLGRRA